MHTTVSKIQSILTRTKPAWSIPGGAPAEEPPEEDVSIAGRRRRIILEPDPNGGRIVVPGRPQPPITTVVVWPTNPHIVQNADETVRIRDPFLRRPGGDDPKPWDDFVVGDDARIQINHAVWHQLLPSVNGNNGTLVMDERTVDARSNRIVSHP